MDLTIASIGDAAEYLNALGAGMEPPERILFAGELSAFHIRIEGDKYHSSVPAELARGLWQLQEELYSAAAYALYGTGDIRKLTNDQREAFELVFEVKEGSSDFFAQLGKFFEKLGEGFSNMDATNKARTLIVIAAIVGVAYGAGQIVSGVENVQKEGIKADQVVKLEEQRSRQFEIITNAMAGMPAAQKFNQATTEGTKAVVRSASDARLIEVGATTFDQDDIQEVTRRAPRAQTVPDMISTEFRIFKVDVRDVGVMKYVLAGQGTGEFVATMDESQFTPEELAAVMSAATERKKIRLEVLIARSNGAVKSAQIMQVL